MKLRCLIVFLLLQNGCSYFQGSKPPRDVVDKLDESYAQLRKEYVSQVDYNLAIDLTQKDFFQGTLTVNFKLKELFYLTLDFAGGKVQELIVNGKNHSPVGYNGYFIELPNSLLRVGTNNVIVKYTHPYSKNGMGLYRYQDLETKKSYIYSHFEPYKANQAFPCFDQPNLKARYKLSLLAPKEWQVISSVREEAIEALAQYKRWHFPISPKMSSYTFSLHAGDYQVWEYEAQTKKQTIPLRLFARKALAPYIKPDLWFEMTEKGFQFFEKYFSYPYPYKKYDQLVVPDFNYGAMENIAAVTFNEDGFVSRGEMSHRRMMFLANTIFHEQAHMWFGNLVTMDWWGDLWLNESFATYAATLALERTKLFEEAWSVFNIYTKQRAYRIDQSVNTHPISLDVPSTADSFTYIDGITYGKGASALRQLSFLVGEKKFRKALKTYFNSYANKNTKLKDFIAAIASASGENLTQWEQRWLKTAMLNAVEVFYTCKKGRINQFEVFQTGTQDYPTLRTHKTKIALFRRVRGQYKLHHHTNVTYKGGRTEVKKLIGKHCPDIVYPNYKDYDYVRVRFDKRSLKNIESSLAAIKDPYFRSLLWSDLWQMVLNKELDMDRYLEIAEFNGLNEDEPFVLGKILSNINSILKNYYPNKNEWEKRRKIWVHFFEQAYLNKLSETIETPELQKIWYTYLVSVSESTEMQKLFVRLLKKRATKDFSLSFSIDQDRRWRLIAQLMKMNHPKAKELLVVEERQDKSKRGQLSALYAQSLEPSLGVKRKFYDQVLSQRQTQTLGVLSTIMRGLFPSQQSELQKGFTDDFYKTLKKIHKRADPPFVATFVANLVPAYCDKKSSAQLESFIKAEKSLAFRIANRLRSALFENRRCYEMRKTLQTTYKKRQMEAS